MKTIYNCQIIITLYLEFILISISYKKWANCAPRKKEKNNRQFIVKKLGKSINLFDRQSNELAYKFIIFFGSYVPFIAQIKLNSILTEVNLMAHTLCAIIIVLT